MDETQAPVAVATVEPAKEKRELRKEFRPEYFNALVEFYADPSEQRNLKQFAADHNVNYSTLYGYTVAHSEDLFDVVDSVRSKFIPKLRSAAYNAVFRNVNKSFNDRKLALQLTRDLVEENKTTLEFKTPDEKRARINQLFKGLQEKIAKEPV